jgi:aminotransferase
MTSPPVNPRVRDLPASGIRALYERKRPSSIDLSIGQPSLKPDAEPFETAAQWVRANGCSYPPYAGIPELREAVARAYGGSFHRTAGDICVTNGSQQAIFLALKTLLDPARDEVLLTDPGYPSYVRCCDLEGIRWRAVTLDAADGFAIKAGALLAVLSPRVRAIVIGSPSNPTGAVMSASELDALARGLQASRHQPPVLIVDEVYRELVYGTQPYRSVTDTYAPGLAVQSMSKSCALTGLRVGFLIGPQAIIDAAMRAHVLMLMSISQLGQRVALEFMRSPARLRAHHDWYVRQRALMLEAAHKARLEFIEPQGAFYTLVKLPQRWHSRSAEAATSLLEDFDVVTVAGSVFGKACAGYLRVSWSAPAAAVTEGLARIGEFCERSR